MSNRSFLCMIALAILSGVMTLLSPPAAVFPALMLFVLGFDAIATEARKKDD